MGKTLFYVALPIIIQNLIVTSLALVDNLMVGTLGETELAAVGVSIQIFFIQNLLVYGFSSGTATFMSQFYGTRDFVSIKKVGGFAICICFGISLIFFMVALFFPENVLRCFTNIPEVIAMGTGYLKIASSTLLLFSISYPLETMLRTTQQTRLPLYISLVVFSTNTFLNYVFIFGNFGAPTMGIEGAALGTLIARVLELVLLIFVIFIKKNVVGGSLKDYFGCSKKLIIRIIRNSIPTTVNEVMWSLGTAMYVAAYARVGITAYAAVQASNSITHLFIVTGFSIGDAALILIGEELGKNKKEYAYQLSKRLLFVGVGIGIISGLLLILTSKAFVGLFSLTEEGHKYALLVLLVYGLTMPINIFNGMTITGVLRGGGDTRFAMLAEIMCVWLYGVPMAFIASMVMDLPIYLIVLLVKMEDVIKCVILFRRFISKKWVNNVIDNL